MREDGLFNLKGGPENAGGCELKEPLTKIVFDYVIEDGNPAIV